MFDGDVVFVTGMCIGDAGVAEEAFDLSRRPAWHRDALCSEYPNVDWFPERGDDIRPAKVICTRCLAREQCLEFALANNEKFGVWGGASAQDRKALRRQRRQATTAA